MPEPTWKQNLSDDQLAKIGFEPYGGAENDPAFELVATVTVDKQLSKNIELRYSPEDPEHLYLVIESEPKWLHLPFKPTPKKLAEVYARYVQPRLDTPPMAFGAELLAQTVVAREAVGRVRLSTEGVKKVAWFIGKGSYDDTMVSIENGYVFNSWLSFDSPRQATANGGLHSQWYTAYSRSLVTITRTPTTTTAVFVLEVEYVSSFHEEFTKSVLEQHLKDTPLESVPIDLPLDVIGFLYEIQSNVLATRDHLINLLKEGDTSCELLIACMTPDAEFEEVYLPLTEMDNQVVRDQIAREAMFRENKTIFAAVEARGISDDVKWPVEP